MSKQDPQSDEKNVFMAIFLSSDSKIERDSIETKEPPSKTVTKSDNGFLFLICSTKLRYFECKMCAEIDKNNSENLKCVFSVDDLIRPISGFAGKPSRILVF